MRETHVTGSDASICSLRIASRILFVQAAWRIGEPSSVEAPPIINLSVQRRSRVSPAATPQWHGWGRESNLNRTTASHRTRIMIRPPKALKRARFADAPVPKSRKRRRLLTVNTDVLPEAASQQADIQHSVTWIFVKRQLSSSECQPGHIPD
jgi:hypothetical protein